MNENTLVSIIVPIYGVEAYLAECVDSLLAQTYKNIEIILVNDESPDYCGEICDNYVKRDSRVRAIHKKNGGAASARNVGLEAATGAYICFVDSDDIVAINYIQRLYEQIQKEEADIVVCGFWQFTKMEKCQCIEHEPIGVYDRNAYLLQFLKSWTCALLWNKLYRREVIGSLRMEEGHRIDDEFFTYQVVLNAKKIVVFDEALYRYRLRASSVMRNMESHELKVMQDRLEYLWKRYRHVESRIPELKSAFFLDVLDSYTRYWTSCKDMLNVQEEIRTWAKSNFVNILNADMPFKQRIAYLYALFLRKAGNASLFSSEERNASELFD